MEKRNIILADNQYITSVGIECLCSKEEQAGNLIKVKNKQELMENLALSPDAMVILDYTLFDLASVDELLILRERFAASDWLLCSDALNEYFVQRAALEKLSIVQKDCLEEEFSQAISAVLQSQQFFCRSIANQLQSHKNDSSEAFVSLTATEKDILKLIANGKKTKEIADERFLSPHTIATHRKNIFRKLDVNNAYEAIKYAHRAGIIDEAEYYI